MAMMQTPQFGGFQPSGKAKIAQAMGFQGPMEQFDKFLQDNPDRQSEMMRYEDFARKMVSGGYVRKMQTGGMAFGPQASTMPAMISTADWRTGIDPKTGKESFKREHGAGPSFTGYPNYANDIANEQMAAAKALNLQKGFFESDEYKNIPAGSPSMFASMIDYRSPYFGRIGHGGAFMGKESAGAVDSAYEAYLKRTGLPAFVDPRDAVTSPPANQQPQSIGQISAELMDTPSLPQGAAVTPVGTVVTDQQLVPTGSGQVDPRDGITAVTAETTQAQTPQQTQASTITPTTSAQDVATALAATQAAQGTIDPKAEIIAAQQTASSVADVQAAQGNAVLMANPVQREIQDGELISGSANAEKAAKFIEAIQAAEATPSKQATVQGQLEALMQQFEGGNTPLWAQGAMRNVQAEMAKRGLGSSSMAAQAMMQAALESSLPIAQMDASTIAKFEATNLSNKQQRAILAAEQRANFMGMEFTQDFQARVANSARIGEIANMNFTAEQSIALENSRAANTMNMANLSNSQAMVLAEASALANLDMSNLNNRQQSAVQNAQNFLAMDMANLSSQQQMDLFSAQQRVQSLFTDQAAQNAAAQFNATSQNQTDQFFANLASAASQFNTAQANAQAQFNAGQTNTVAQFQEQVDNQRDTFNAQNRLVIDQNNANWRRQVATADTVAVNRANELNASALLGISNTAYNNLWQYYGDSMEWAWTSAENERSRIVNLAIEQLKADNDVDLQEMKEDYASSTAFGRLIGTFLTADSTSWLGKMILG